MIIEQQLRNLFDEQAEQAPHPDGLAAGAKDKVRARRRRWAAGSGAAIMAIIVAVTVPILATGDSQSGPVALPTSVGTAPADRGGQPPDSGPGGAAASCVSGAGTLRFLAENADFAFDGTVVSIGEPRHENGRLERHLPGAHFAAVTFRVNEWFRGGQESTVVIDMLAPTDVGHVEDADLTGYRVGTRLLISGAGPFRSAAIMGGCGSVRYYSASLAARWAAAIR